MNDKLGLTDRELFKIQRELGTGALSKVKENPYILSRLFPLNTVDAIAKKLQVAPHRNVNRGVAVAEYELDRALLEGHCYVHTHTLLAKARGDCRFVTPADFNDEDLALHGTIVVEGKYSMLRTIFDAEAFVSARVAALCTAAADDCVPLDAVVEARNEDGRIRDVDQEQAIRLISRASIAVITGAPGCHRVGQGLLRSNGQLVAVEDVRIGDRLAGFAGAVRTVQELRRGSGEMVRINPTKGAAFVVNHDHILTVVHSLTNEVVDVSVRDFMTWNATRREKSKLLRQSFDFEGATEKQLISPYILGVLLGDGSLSSGAVKVATPDREIVAELQTECRRLELQLCRVQQQDEARCPIYGLTGDGSKGGNAAINALRALGLFGLRSGDKFIPPAYRYGSAAQRRELLAGLLDTDGHLTDGCYDYISKSQVLAEDVVFLARSVGLAAYVRAAEKFCQTGAGGVYWRVSISGNVDTLPLRIARKRAAPRQQKKDALRTGFTIELLPAEIFYGFTLDGDGRYLLDDFTVTHNTGKTTCTRTALDLLDDAHVTYALCAPTGKAARRFSEVTGREATTIHRLLQWRPTGFEHNEHAPLPHDVVICDETSMVDIRLAADLLAAINPLHTRIIFIGDANQLPPVGPGAFFTDLIASKKVETVYLTTLHRAAAGSWIYRNAPKILAGVGVELDAEVPDFDWYEMETDGADGIGAVAVNVIRKLIADGHSWDDFQLLTPMRIRGGGANELNPFIRKELIDKQGVIAKIGAYESEAEVCRGDRVIQIKNDYELDIFNGECGQIALVESPSSVRVRFEDEYRNVKGARLKNMALAYALTIHKGQGSQWPTVIVVCHSTHGRMLNRRLFYTAVTRAQNKVILIGDEAGVKQAIKNVQDMRRRTLLVNRITDATA